MVNESTPNFKLFSNSSLLQMLQVKIYMYLFMLKERKGGGSKLITAVQYMDILLLRYYIIFLTYLE